MNSPGSEICCTSLREIRPEVENCGVQTEPPLATVLVKDINTGASSSYPRALRTIGSTLYFSARNAENGTELWRSNGSTRQYDLSKGHHRRPGWLLPWACHRDQPKDLGCGWQEHYSWVERTLAVKLNVVRQRWHVRHYRAISKFWGGD